MQRLLHEGMDAGLCGFSIQRLGPNSMQADFDGTPDGDRHDVRRGHPRPRPRCCAERDEGFIQITQATGDDQAPTWRSLREAGRGRPAADPRTTRSPPARSNPDDPPRAPRAGSSECRAKGLPIFGQCATIRAGFAFTLEHWNLYDASPAWRDVTTGTKDEKLRQDGRPGAPRGARATRPRRPTRCCTPIQAGVGGTPAQAGRAGRQRPAPSSQQYVGQSLGEIAEEEGKHPIEVMLDLSLAERPERRVPRPGPRLQRRVHGRDDQRLALHDPRRVRRRRPHQVLHRRRVDAPTS